MDDGASRLFPTDRKSKVPRDSVQRLYSCDCSISAHLLLSYTRIGRDIYAVGGNKDAAVRMGVNLVRTYLFVFVFLGVLTGIAAIVYFSPSAAILPTSATGLEMTIVASVVLGGASINGGRGNVGSTLLGVFLLGLIQNALVLAHVQAYWQNILNGVFIVVPVVADAIRVKYDTGEWTRLGLFRKKATKWEVKFDEKKKTPR